MALQIFKIAESIVSTPQTSVTFSSIPQNYTDLLIYVSARSNRASGADNITMSLNGSTSNVTWKLIYTDGTNIATASGTNNSFVYVTGANATSNSFGNSKIYIPNYNSSTNPKIINMDGAAANNSTSDSWGGIDAVLWNPATQAAITSIGFGVYNGTGYLTNSAFTIYGIL